MNKKMCPIVFLVRHGAFDHCRGENCEWYNEESGRCIVHDLSRISSTLFKNYILNKKRGPEHE